MKKKILFFLLNSVLCLNLYANNSGDYALSIFASPSISFGSVTHWSVDKMLTVFPETQSNISSAPTVTLNGTASYYDPIQSGALSYSAGAGFFYHLYPDLILSTSLSYNHYAYKIKWNFAWKDTTYLSYIKQDPSMDKTATLSLDLLHLNIGIRYIISDLYVRSIIGTGLFSGINLGKAVLETTNFGTAAPDSSISGFHPDFGFYVETGLCFSLTEIFYLNVILKFENSLFKTFIFSGSAADDAALPINTVRSQNLSLQLEVNYYLNFKE